MASNYDLRVVQSLFIHLDFNIFIAKEVPYLYYTHRFVVGIIFPNIKGNMVSWLFSSDI
jgi:hypothetical protein